VRDVDPQVHRVHRDEAGARALLANAELEVGLDVGQEEDVAGLGRVGELGLEVLEDVEVGDERLALVEVVGVDALPEERLAARHLLDVVGDRPAGAQDRERVVVEVLADGADGADLVEEGGRQREVRRGAAEHPLALPERGLDAIEGDGSDDSDAHGSQ
jgi:hypothetical protein